MCLAQKKSILYQYSPAGFVLQPLTEPSPEPGSTWPLHKTSVSRVHMHTTVCLTIPQCNVVFSQMQKFMNEWMNSASKQHMRTQSVIEQMLQTWIRNLQKSVTDQELSVCWRRQSLCAALQSQHWWGGASETGSYLLWHHHHWTAPLITPEHTQLRLSMAVLTYPVRSRQVCSGVLQVGQNITSDWTEGNCRGRGSRDSRMRMEARLKSTRLTNLLNLNNSLGKRHRQTEKRVDKSEVCTKCRVSLWCRSVFRHM